MAHKYNKSNREGLAVKYVLDFRCVRCNAILDVSGGNLCSDCIYETQVTKDGKDKKYGRDDKK